MLYLLFEAGPLVAPLLVVLNLARPVFFDQHQTSQKNPAEKIMVDICA
jgi:hypothetical protein